MQKCSIFFVHEQFSMGHIASPGSLDIQQHLICHLHTHTHAWDLCRILPHCGPFFQCYDKISDGLYICHWHCCQNKTRCRWKIDPNTTQHNRCFQRSSWLFSGHGIIIIIIIIIMAHFGGFPFKYSASLSTLLSLVGVNETDWAASSSRARVKAEDHKMTNYLVCLCIVLCVYNLKWCVCGEIWTLQIVTTTRS